MPGIGISIGLANVRGASGPPAWTLADLSPGVLVFAHELRGNTTIGSVADGARVSSWSDAGPSVDPLASSGTDRPIYRAAQRGGRPLLEFDVAGVEDRFMAGAVNRTITHLLAVGKFRRPNTTLGSTTIPAYFDSYRGFVGLNGYDGLYPGGQASVILTGASAASTFFDAYSATTYRKDGVVGTPSSADPGLERVAHLWEISRTGTFSGYPVVVGRDRNITGSAARWRGDARAVIGLSSPSADDLTRLRTYLAWYQKGSIVAHTGDSLRFGYGVTGFQCDAALLDAAYNGTVDCPNYAIPGQGLSVSTYGANPNLLADDPAKLDGLPAGRPVAILMVQVGTNDAAIGRTDSQVVADLWTYCDARRAAGWRVVVFTLTDRTDAAVSAAQAAFDAKRASVNTSIRSGWATHADALVDLAADVLLGANGAANNATYFSADRVHYTALTYSSIVLPLVQAAAESLLPA